MTTEYKVIGGVVLLTLVIIIGGTWLASKSGAENRERLDTPLLGEKMPDMGGEHVAPGKVHSAYNSNPPTSGPHWAGVAGPGIKDKPTPDELVLHRRDHGPPVLGYREAWGPDKINKIKDAFTPVSERK